MNLYELDIDKKVKLAIDLGKIWLAFYVRNLKIFYGPEFQIFVTKITIICENFSQKSHH